MNHHSGTTVSAWMPEAVPTAPALHENTRADVCIVGAGISGLSVAYQLTREGKSVVVLDDGPMAAGETERTTAHLSYALDDRFSVLEKMHGLETTRLAVQSHKAAIDEIESIIRNESIDCDFSRLYGYLFVPPTASTDLLEAELESAHRLGLADVSFVPRVPWPDYNTGRCLRFPGQGQFHPLKYLNGLIRAIQAGGGRIFCNTSASGFEGGIPARVTTANGFKVDCDAIIVATNAPVNDRVTIHSKQAPYRTYAVGLKIPRNSVPMALYWDTAQDAESQKKDPMSAPYHYVRLQHGGPSHDLLIVGGEDHKTGQADDGQQRWIRLELWARKRFQVLGIAFRWSGQVMEPVDGLAYIGRNPGDHPNVYIATGDSGQGMTHGTIAGMLIRDLILSRQNAWEQPYNPSRKAARSASVYLRENLNVAAKYTEWIRAGEVKSVEDIPPGRGAVLRRGLRKIAAYKAQDGAVHELSAICPHLGCVVHWNSLERSWDCPCHGSRFTADGDVLNGPALGSLSPAEEAEEQRREAA